MISEDETKFVQRRIGWTTDKATRINKQATLKDQSKAYASIVSEYNGQEHPILIQHPSPHARQTLGMTAVSQYHNIGKSDAVNWPQLSDLPLIHHQFWVKKWRQSVDNDLKELKNTNATLESTKNLNIDVKIKAYNEKLMANIDALANTVEANKAGMKLNEAKLASIENNPNIGEIEAKMTVALEESEAKMATVVKAVNDKSMSAIDEIREKIVTVAEEIEAKLTAAVEDGLDGFTTTINTLTERVSNIEIGFGKIDSFMEQVNAAMSNSKNLSDEFKKSITELHQIVNEPVEIIGQTDDIKNITAELTSVKTDIKGFKSIIARMRENRSKSAAYDEIPMSPRGSESGSAAGILNKGATMALDEIKSLDTTLNDYIKAWGQIRALEPEFKDNSALYEAFQARKLAYEANIGHVISGKTDQSTLVLMRDKIAMWAFHEQIKSVLGSAEKAKEVIKSV